MSNLNPNRWYRKYQTGGKILQAAQQLIAAIKQQPEQAKQMISELMQTKQGVELLQVAAQMDRQAGQLIEQVSQSMQMAKKGVKLKEACRGIKMEKGSKTKKLAKGKPCPCLLKKIGGKLIEVDCNGIPVAKKGKKIAFAEVGTTLINNWEALTVGDTATTLGLKHYYYDKDSDKWMQQVSGDDYIWGNPTELNTSAEDFSWDDVIASGAASEGYDPNKTTTIRSSAGASYTMNSAGNIVSGNQVSNRDIRKDGRKLRKSLRAWAKKNYDNSAINFVDLKGKSKSYSNYKDLQRDMNVRGVTTRSVMNHLDKNTGMYGRYLKQSKEINDLAGTQNIPTQNPEITLQTNTPLPKESANLTNEYQRTIQTRKGGLLDPQKYYRK